MRALSRATDQTLLVRRIKRFDCDCSKEVTSRRSVLQEEFSVCFVCLIGETLPLIHDFPGSRLCFYALFWLTVDLDWTVVVADQPVPLRDEYSLDVWQVEDGLPDNSVNAIVQTPDGYLWFGTFNGLVRFDGLRFQRMDSRVPGLESGRVVQLFLDRQGALWIAMEYGQIARYSRGIFTVLSTEDGWTGARARFFSEDEIGRLLVSSVEGGLFRFDGKRFQRLLSDDTGPAFYGCNLYGNLAKWPLVRRGEYVGTLEGDQWKPITEPGGTAQLRVSGWGVSGKGGIWLDTGGRIMLMRDGQWVRDSGAQPWSTNTAVKFMREDSQGDLWVGTWNEGLFRCPPGGAFSRYSTLEGFPNDTLRCFHEDREGNLWMGTDGAGLIRLKRRVFRSFDARHGLPPAGLTTLAQDPLNGRLQGAMKDQVFELKGEHWELLSPIPSAGPMAAVFALLFDHAGRRWLGTYGQGVFAVDTTGLKQWTHAHGLVSPDVLSLYEGRSGAIWIGTEAGLSCFADEQFTHFTTTNCLHSNAIRALTEDANGNLWIGTTGGGLSRLSDGKVTTFRRANGLPQDSIRSLLADNDGTLWIGSSGGGLAWMHDGFFSQFSTQEGLPDNEIAVILDDTLGNLWLGSNHGVFRVARDELRAVAQGGKKRLEGITYLGGDGLASAQISGGQTAGLRSQDGRLWFATSRGVSVVDPRQIRVNPLPPTVEIEEALADGTTLHSSDRDGIKTGFIIPPGTARTEFRYTALSLTNPERNRFRVLLEGYDTDWSEVSTRRTAYYSKVTPGTYRFRVLAANSDGVWNDAGAAVSVTFLPTWWQTWTFRITAGLLPLAVLLGAYHRRVRGLKLARVQQEEFSRRLLASQEVERARVARELHDSLGQNLLVIKSRLALAQQQSHQPVKLAEQLAEAAAMTSDAIREVREISQNLRPFQLDELGLTKALAAMVRKLGASSPIQFRSDLAELGGAFSPEYEINFYRIAQECLNNVVKHSDARQCSLSVTRNDRVVCLIVADDGQGFSMPTLPTSGKPHEGFGLSSIQERARTMSAQVEFVTGHGEGTRVTVVIPL